MKHAINLCATVEARARYSTPKCTVRTLKEYPPAFVFDRDDPEYMSEDVLYHWDHRWSDKRGGLAGGQCEKCGFTLKEIRVRVNPKTGEPVRKSRLAREIGRMQADVPPVRFTGAPL